MKVKIGAITIGQSPRTDVTNDILPLLGDNIELLQSGALDTLSLEDIHNFSPIAATDYILVSKMRDGSEVKFAERHILPLLQDCICQLEAAGATAIIFLCTGDFEHQFQASVPLIFPNTILSALVPPLAPSSKIAVLTPNIGQLEQSRQKWNKFVSSVSPIVLSPYQDDAQQTKQAIAALTEADVELVVMDCIGYSEQLKKQLRQHTGKNIVLSRTLVARIIKELVD